MTEEELLIVEKSNTTIKRLTLIYYTIVVLPLPVLFIVMLDNYIIKEEFFEAFQQPIYDREMSRLWSITAAVLVLEYFLFRVFKRKLIALRNLNIYDALKQYKKLNIYFYIALGLCAYPFFFLFIDTLLYLYAGVFSMLVFIIMALERPSARRLIRNLRIKKPLSDRINGIPEKTEEKTTEEKM